VFEDCEGVVQVKAVGGECGVVFRVSSFERGEVRNEVKLEDRREWSLESFGRGEERWEAGSKCRVSLTSLVRSC